MAEIYRSEIPSGVLYAPIEQTASATIVVGVAKRRIVVLSAWAVCGQQSNLKWQTSTGPVDLSGNIDCAQYGGFVLPFNAGGWFACAVGDSLLLNQVGTGPVGGSISYILV